MVILFLSIIEIDVTWSPTISPVLVSVAITEYYRLDNVSTIYVYLAHSSGGWQVQY